VTRSKNIIIRVTPEEHAQLTAAADRERRALSDWGRLVLLDKLHDALPSGGPPLALGTQFGLAARKNGKAVRRAR